MTKIGCCCSCFSCFSGRNTPPPSASPNASSSSADVDTTSASPTVATRHDPQAPPSTSTPMSDPAQVKTIKPSFPSSSADDQDASSSAVAVKQDQVVLSPPSSGASSSSTGVPSPPPSGATSSDATTSSSSSAVIVKQGEMPPPPPSSATTSSSTVQTVSGASTDINKDIEEGVSPSVVTATVVKQDEVVPPHPSGVASSSSTCVPDEDNVDVDLDGLIEKISHRLELIKEGGKRSQTKVAQVQQYWPTASKTFFKLKEFLSVGINFAKVVIPGDAIKTVVRSVLQGMGAADLVTAGLVVVANTLERFEEVGANKTECLRLLKEMIFLAKLVKQFKECSQLKEGMYDAIKEATELIVEGSAMCFYQIDSSKYSKFFKAPVNKEALNNFRTEVDRVYRQINTQMGISIFHAIDRKKAPLSRRYPDHAVGIDESVKEVIDLLEWGSEKNAIAIVLHGFGGLGKTTLADAIFSLVEVQACKYSSVQLFENTDSTPKITELQRLILKDLTEPGETIPEIRKVEDGQRELGRMLEKVPAFIYIDNVLRQDELGQLLPRDMKKAKKVRLLFTARDMDIVRRALKVKPFVYAMKGLLHTEAVQLLEREINGETDDNEKQINSTQLNNIVKSYGGIPKLLELVGAFIRAEEDKQNAYGILMKEREMWDNEYGKMESWLFAYNHLPERSKDPFLDICFFFKGWDWDTVADIVGKLELNTLRSRALVTKGTNGAVIVHDVILSIGLQKTKGMRLRFTDAKQVKGFLADRDEKEFQEIKGIWLSENKDLLDISASKLNFMFRSLRVLALGKFVKVHEKCNNRFEKLVFFQAAIPNLPFDVSQSKELRYLNYKPKDLNFLEIPSSLRHMEFDGRLLSRGFEISSHDLPKFGNLTILKLTHFEELKKLPQELGDLIGLRELTLSHCTSLKELPGSISKLPSLRVFRMDHCSSLSHLPEDFGKLSSLQELDLKGCKNLEALPDSFDKLTALRILNLSSCERLMGLPHGLGRLTSIAELHLNGCSQLRTIPESIGQLKCLGLFMDMSKCSSLEELPNGFCDLSFFTRLSLEECSNLEKLPDRFGELGSLRKLYLFHCTSLKKLPEGFGQLKNLTFLDLQRCSNLEELCNDFHCLDSLQILYLYTCHRLKSLPQYFHRLASLRQLDLSDCPMLEEKEMDNVVKIKTLEHVQINQSPMLMKRWGELYREGNPSWSFLVTKGENLPQDQKENIEKNLLSEFNFVSNGEGGPFHLSDHLREDSLLLIMFDWEYDFPWPLFEEAIDEIQTKFEIIYLGDNFNEVPSKVKGKIVGHGGRAAGGDNVFSKMLSTLDIADQARQEFEKNIYFQMWTKMAGDEKGAEYRPCWKLLTSREVEEFLLSNCRSYHRLTQLALTSGESNIELLRELFASGKGQDPRIFQKNYASQQVPNENRKPFACVEELKGKRVFLEMRPIDMCYDIRLGSLIQLYNTEKELLNLEVISIPFVQSIDDIRLDVFEEFSGHVPWLVLQNPLVITRVVKYFLIKQCLPDQGSELWDEESKIVYPSIITIIESNGKIFTPSQPVLPLLDKWGSKAYPFTVEKIKELEEEECSQLETMSNLEFLFHNQERVLHQVKEAMLQQRRICLFGGNGYEEGTSLKEFTCFLWKTLINFRDSIQIIYIPAFDYQDVQISKFTDTIDVSYCLLKTLDLPQAEMEGVPLLNLAEHDAMRFWIRFFSYDDKLAEIDGNDKKWDGFKMLMQPIYPDAPWMILIDKDGKMVTKNGKEIISLCTRNMEDQAKKLLYVLIKGTEEEKQQALLE